MTNFIFTSMKVLDHGYVELKNIAGPVRRQSKLFDADDRDPAIAARMSFNKAEVERTAEDDERLCRYLMKNWHTSPFEMIEIWLNMKLPIFVARQFVRHRTTSINEISGRYVQLPAEWYIPAVVGGKAANAKQGQEDNLGNYEQYLFKNALEAHCKKGYFSYESAIKMGVAPEHARMFLSLNHYTIWMWKQDLHNMMHFLSLRADAHAQVEAQAYARAIIDILRSVLPSSMALFDEYRRKTSG